MLANDDISAKVILEHRVDFVDQFFNSVVKPREYEADERIKAGLKLILEKGKVAFYARPKQNIPTYTQFLEELNDQRRSCTDKPHYLNAIEKIHDTILDYMEEHGLSENQEVDENFVRYIDRISVQTIEEFKVHEKSGLYAWGTTRNTLINRIKKRMEEEKREAYWLTAEKIRDLLEGETRLICISISDPAIIKELVITLAQNLLIRRKRRFQVKPYIFLVFDEAQEFIPELSGASGIDRKCSRQVEMLLRQGRKYGIGVCIATQRIAYLNTNALQQLHTYFVGTLPRPYDRALISDTFMIDKGMLEKTLEFAPGEWLPSSYIATGIENVPIFIKADNAEKEIEKFLKNSAYAKLAV